MNRQTLALIRRTLHAAHRDALRDARGAEERLAVDAFMQKLVRENAA